MSVESALGHGSTAIIGMVMLGMMAWGTLKYGFFRQFDQQLGRRIMLLGWLDAVGLVIWH